MSLLLQSDALLFGILPHKDFFPVLIRYLRHRFVLALAFILVVVVHLAHVLHVLSWSTDTLFIDNFGLIIFLLYIKQGLPNLLLRPMMG